MSQTKELGKDLAYQSKARRLEIYIMIVLIGSLSYFISSLMLDSDFIWFYNPFVDVLENIQEFKFYAAAVFGTELLIWIYFFYNGKFKSIFDYIARFILLDGVGRYKQLSKEFFYQQPIVTDGLKRKKNKLSLFSKNYDASISRLFDFEDKNPTTARIVKYFRSNNHYIDYFKIIEGYLNENQYDAIYEYDTNNHQERKAYRAYKKGIVYFSPTLIKQELNIITKDFSRYLQANLSRPTSVNKKIKSMETNEINKLVDVFAFVLFHKIIINFTNIPTGLVESKLDDYDFRRIINYYQNDGFTIEVSSDNNGTNKSFSNDTFSSTFLTLYNKYMNDGPNQIDVKNMLKKFDPLADVEEEKPELNIDLSVQDIRPDEKNVEVPE